MQGALESTSFTAFLNALLNCWMKVDSKDKNIVTQVGLLVDEPGARLFMKRVEGWASSSGGFHLAMAGLRGLALRGDNGLRLVHRMSLKAKSQGLRKNAAYALNAAASERKLSRVELEDRLVPDLDLGADGGTWLDFGPRRFRVGFDENLKPTVRDEAGKLLKDLPKPNQSDDAEKSAEATERWKQLKKEVRELAPCRLPDWKTRWVPTADGRKTPSLTVLCGIR